MSVEIDWPVFNPEDSRWQSQGSGKTKRYFFTEPTSTPGLERTWRVENSVLPYSQTCVERYHPAQSIRRIQRLTYPSMPEIEQPQIRCTLTSHADGLPQSVSIYSSGYSWKESSTKDAFQLNTFDVKFGPSGQVSTGNLSTIYTDDHKTYNTEFDFVGLREGRIAYKVTESNVSGADDVFKQLKTAGSASALISVNQSTLVTGSANLNREFSLFKSVFYIVEGVSTDLLRIRISRRTDQSEYQAALIVPRTTVAGNIPSLETTCFADPTKWQELIGENLLKLTCD